MEAEGMDDDLLLIIAGQLEEYCDCEFCPECKLINMCTALDRAAGDVCALPDRFRRLVED